MNVIMDMLQRDPRRKGRYIAEIGLNHNGDPDMAAAMIRAAVGAGADAVKFQTIFPVELVSPYGKALMEEGRESFRDDETVEFFKKFFFNMDQYRELARVAGEEGVIFFSSPFSVGSVDFLEEIPVSLYKVASSEVTHLALLERIAATERPVLMSTGMAREGEIATALDLFDGRCDVVLLHCVSNYPLDPEKANLNRIARLQARFGKDVGFSDHSEGSDLARLASMLGARIFEKHFTIDESYDCPDRALSVTPQAFSALIEEVEEAITIAGEGDIDFGVAEEEIARGARRSLFARRRIPAGRVITDEDIIALRPGVGISPAEKEKVTGRRAACDIESDMLIRDEFLET